VIEDFIRAIETGTVPSCDGREGRRSVELVEAIYTAAREKRTVNLSNPGARISNPNR
jgi:predicted dehydrogenase